MIVNPYTKITKKPMTPVYKPGEDYSFYINFDTPISDPDYLNFRLEIWQGTTRVASNFNTPRRDIIRNVLYNLYSVFTMPACPNGYYQFVIMDTVHQVEKCRSNFILVENSPIDDVTTRVIFRNETDTFNTGYEALQNFYHIFRLPVFQIDYQFEVNKTQYRNVTDRRLRNLLSYRDKVVKAESYYFDEDAHDAMSAMYEHSHVFLNYRQFWAKDAYSIATDVQRETTKGTVNLYCDPANIIFTFTFNTGGTNGFIYQLPARLTRP